MKLVQPAPCDHEFYEYTKIRVNHSEYDDDDNRVNPFYSVRDQLVRDGWEWEKDDEFWRSDKSWKLDGKGETLDKDNIFIYTFRRRLPPKV